MSKWNGRFWGDLAERVASSALGGVLTMLGLQYGDLIHATGEKWAVVVLIPAGTSLVKGLLANMATGAAGQPSASVVDVSSNPN